MVRIMPPHNQIIADMLRTLHLDIILGEFDDIQIDQHCMGSNCHRGNKNSVTPLLVSGRWANQGMNNIHKITCSEGTSCNGLWENCGGFVHGA